MLIRLGLWGGLLLGGLTAAFADVLELKDNASLTGKILAEKRDQVVLDVGYTVLSVPRNQIHRITRGDAPAKGKAAKAAPVPAPVERQTGLYQTATTLPAERSVRELVSQLGEAVVQVRTPSGLGSG